MANYHCSIKIISRGKGKTAVGAAAYRSGTKIKNEYDGETHDYTKKGGVFSSTILLPDHAPKEYKDRATLWNAVEKVEKAKNAQLAREIEVSIPIEIPEEDWEKMMYYYCQKNFVSKGMIADFSIHNNNQNNPHCHIMLTMRPITKDGKWGAKCRKEYVLDENDERIKLPSGNWKSIKVSTTDWNEQTKAEYWRESWSLLCNAYLEKLGHNERVDHRSYKRQKIGKISTIHMGVAACQMERKGIATERGNINREIADNNKTLKSSHARITRLMKWQRELKKQPLELDQSQQSISLYDLLRAEIPSINRNQYQKIKRLKDKAQVLIFLQNNDIRDVDDFVKTIVQINKSFYVLKGEFNEINSRKQELQKTLDLFSEFKALYPIVKKFDKLKDDDRDTFYMANCESIERFNKINDYLHEIGFKPKTFAAELKSCERDLGLIEWKMNEFKVELGRAEKLKKLVDEVGRVEKVKRRDDISL